MNFNLPAGATARLEMTAGSLVSPAELAEEMAKYQYVRDAKDASRWNFQSEAEADAGANLRLVNDGEAIEIHTWSPENMMNVNYIAMRIGWSECRMIALNHQAHQMLSMRMYSVQVTEEHLIEGSLDTAASPAPEPVHEKPANIPEARAAAPAAAPPSQPEAPAVADLEAVQTLTVRANQAEAQVAELESENAALREQVASLKAAPATTRSAPSGNVPADTRLLAFIEKHLLEQVDLKIVHDSQLGQDLRAIGYTLQCKLVPAQ